MSIVKERGMEVNIGISGGDREAIAEQLSKVLADTYFLYLKTQNYHWNVTGNLFHSLHELFEEQYTEMASSIDVIAERIRALGFRAPGSFEEFSELTVIDENRSRIDAHEMVRQLAADNEQAVLTAQEALKPANKVGDEASIDILTERLRAHSKAAWMLRSLIE
jgi:starvation-inducible DNA-binding protein